VVRTGIASHAENRSPARAVLRLLTVLLVVALSACAPQLAQLGLETRTPVLEADHFVTRDGLSLGMTQWQAENPHAVIIALHGMNDYANAFALPAPLWRERGITTYAYDQRGFGRSPHTGIWPGGDVLRQDLADVVDAVRLRHPGLPVFALGESMGGAVVLSAMGSKTPPQADGVILIAPAVWGWSTLPFPYRATLWGTAHLLPWISFTGSGLKVTPTDNIELLRANGRDPLIIKGTRTDAIFGLVNLMNDGLAAGDKVQVPLLLLYGGRDQVIPKNATDALLKRLGPNARVKCYDEGYHMLLRDLAAAPRWSDVADWIDAQSAMTRVSQAAE
jgi:acylglycerol lipase